MEDVGPNFVPDLWEGCSAAAGPFVDRAGPHRVHPEKVVGHAAKRSDLRSQKS